MNLIQLGDRAGLLIAVALLFYWGGRLYVERRSGALRSGRIYQVLTAGLTALSFAMLLLRDQ